MNSKRTNIPDYNEKGCLTNKPKESKQISLRTKKTKQKLIFEIKQYIWRMDTFATEKDRYKEVYLSTGYALLNFARKFVPEFYAEDIVHDVYLRFWDKQIYKLPNEELRSLLYTAVRNACIDHLRKLQTEQEFIDQHAVQLTLEEICLYESSEEKIMKQDLFLQFLKQSEALPERTRQVFKLSYVDGLRNNEIAEQLGLSVHAVENQLYRALLYLRKHCARYLYIFLC